MVLLLVLRGVTYSHLMADLGLIMVHSGYAHMLGSCSLLMVGSLSSHVLHPQGGSLGFLDMAPSSSKKERQVCLLRLSLASHTRSFLHILLVEVVTRPIYIQEGERNVLMRGAGYAGHNGYRSNVRDYGSVFIIYHKHCCFMPARGPRSLALVEAAAAT